MPQCPWCDTPPRERVLQLVENMVDLHSPNLRICATSRPEADIQIPLASLASHTVSLHEEDGQRKDIDDYVRFVVYSDKHMRRWRVEDKELVVDSLSQRGGGM